MTIWKRLRILWAVLTQNWVEYRCACGEVGYCSVPFDSPTDVCNACADERYERWRAQL